MGKTVAVGPSARGSNPVNNSGGGPGKALPQQPIPGPTSPGQPSAMKRALARKSMPDKGNSFPGSRK